MKLTRGKKIALGLATLWPILYMGLFFLFVLGMMVSMTDPQIAPGILGPSEGGGPPTAFLILFPAHLCTMVLSFGLMVVYVVLVVKNPRLTDTMRIIWVILMLFGGLVAMPVYFWLEVWREPRSPEQRDPDSVIVGSGSGAGSSASSNGGFSTPPGA